MIASEMQLQAGCQMHAAFLNGIHAACTACKADFYLAAGECFCLLGPNGAGKSTTINCLTGVLPATAGEAVVHGSSITHQGGLDRVRGLMGVCPQFDVLWDTLTGREHLMLFGAIKGLDMRHAEKQADALLDQVRLQSHLWDVKLADAACQKSGSC